MLSLQFVSVPNFLAFFRRKCAKSVNLNLKKIQGPIPKDETLFTSQILIF